MVHNGIEYGLMQAFAEASTCCTAVSFRWDTDCLSRELRSYGVTGA
jgi:6-phosphogluconate dehydrogenase (decarboxylating)